MRVKFLRQQSLRKDQRQAVRLQIVRSSTIIFERRIREANELETYVNTYSFDLIFSLCSV